MYLLQTVHNFLNLMVIINKLILSTSSFSFLERFKKQNKYSQINSESYSTKRKSWLCHFPQLNSLRVQLLHFVWSATIKKIAKTMLFFRNESFPNMNVILIHYKFLFISYIICYFLNSFPDGERTEFLDFYL